MDDEDEMWCPGKRNTVLRLAVIAAANGSGAWQSHRVIEYVVWKKGRNRRQKWPFSALGPQVDSFGKRTLRTAHHSNYRKDLLNLAL
jgi:hypothetical protein